MKSNAVANQIVQSISDADLRRHFLLLAQDSDELGESRLANHFLEIAIELFDTALNADSLVATAPVSTRDPIDQFVV